jgi:hypothetical protein
MLKTPVRDGAVAALALDTTTTVIAADDADGGGGDGGWDDCAVATAVRRCRRHHRCRYCRHCHAAAGIVVVPVETVVSAFAAPVVERRD